MKKLLVFLLCVMTSVLFFVACTSGAPSTGVEYSMSDRGDTDAEAFDTGGSSEIIAGDTATESESAVVTDSESSSEVFEIESDEVSESESEDIDSSDTAEDTDSDSSSDTVSEDSSTDEEIIDDDSKWTPNY